MNHTPRPERNLARFGALVTLLTSTAVLAAPTLGAASQWGTGVVVWETPREGHLVGRPGPQMGLACDAAGVEPVIEGDWQGHVLVGTVRLCQSGPRCKRPLARYPLFAFYLESERTLVARVRLDEDCTSTALQEQRLVLEPVTVNRHTLEGSILLARGDAPGARRQFQEGLRAHEDEAPALTGLGEAELKLGRADSAILNFQQSLERRASARAELGLACGYAHKRDRRHALAHFGLALERGLHEPEGAGKGAGFDPDCQSLLRRLRGRRTGSGPLSMTRSQESR